ncbi:MAG: helix-turn-helix domain-containing protein [Flavobacteriales bacterium]|nr:helix-turn-helix domain-containing protein [Flavobacteriales bacterium]
MKHISILIPEGDVVVNGVAGPLIVFDWVNEVMRERGEPLAYAIDLVGVKPESQLYNGRFAIRPNKMLKDIAQTDLVIVPPMSGDLAGLGAINSEAIAWVRAMHAGGAEVGSLCTGAFMLAATGLVDGKACTTHWSVAPWFRSTFPQVDLHEERIITEVNGIYSSGGAESLFNLLLYWLEKFNGREIALQAAKRYEIDIDRDSQAPFLVFQGLKGHGDETVLKAQRILEDKYAEVIGIDELAADLALSPRNFNRRFKDAAGLAPLAYLQRVRIEVAKKQLERGVQVNDAMYTCGYSDHKTFRNIFKRVTSMSPRDYRERYTKVTAEAVRMG